MSVDTIAAIATPLLPSAIGIVRISGEGTRAVLEKIFAPVGSAPLNARVMRYGAVKNGQGEVLDYALCVLFSAEHSYTGEESAEVHCHGSPVVLNEVLAAAFRAGARQAEAGEFTKRAFLNGKMDLTEAEAVIDLIDAETAAAAKSAVRQLDGVLRRAIDAVYSDLLDISSRFYAVVDYPDEDIEDITAAQMGETLARCESALSELLASFARGRILRSGLATAIIGAPNAGKSSLLNALVGYDRAIVTPIAGTTRDTVEEKTVIGGTLLRLVDTAGLRDTDDTVEQLGVERSRRAVESADLILVLTDGTKDALSEEDAEALALAEKSGAPYLRVYTKRDLVPEKEFSDGIAVSSLRNEGLRDLESAITALCPAPKNEGAMLTNERQARSVEEALASVRASREALTFGMTPDAILTEIEKAQTALGELTGRTARADMVERIFSRFCVGK